MDLLDQVFAHVVRLEDLLNGLPNFCCDERAKDLLGRTILCGRQPPNEILAMVSSTYSISFEEMIRSLNGYGGWKRWPHELLSKELARQGVWSLFFRLVGERCFRFVVTECSLFRLYPNNVLVQLSGEPFHHMATSNPGRGHIPRKQPKPVAAPPLENHQSGDVKTKRRRRKRRRMTAADRPPPSTLNLIHSKQLESVRFSARRFVYACNYSERFDVKRSPFLSAHSNAACMEALLINIFGFDPTDQLVGDAAEGLRMLRLSLKRLTRNLRRCYVRRWLDRFCPLPPNFDRLSGHALLVDKFEKPYDVMRLLKALLNHLVPADIVGAANKLKLISRFTRCTVRLGRRDWLCLRHFTVGQKTSQCPWLRRCNFVNDAERRLLGCVVLWLVDLFIQTVRICFYVTEGQGEGACDSTVRFYRKPVWRKLSKAAFVDFQSKCHLRKIDKDVCRTWSRLSRYCTVATLRPLPKANGCRPIVTSINPRKNIVASVNWSLQPILAIMRFIMSRKAHLSGSLVKGMKQVEEHWMRFVGHWRSNDRRPYLFFVRTDMDSCFDHISRAKLISLLKERLFQDAPEALTVRRVFFVRRASNSATRYKSQHWASVDSSCNFYSSWIEGKANTVVEIADTTHWAKSRAMETLFTCINRFVVKRRGKCYHVADGVPQGLAISSFLCNFYLSCMELDALGFVDRQKDFFVRSVDDHFLMTADPQKAIQFYKVLAHGSNEYAVKLNVHKTVLNFDGKNEAAAWSGLEFNCRTLEVRSCFDNNMPAVSYDANPKYVASSKMVSCVRWRSKTMCFNTALNSNETILYNARQTFVAAASILRYLNIRFGRRRFPLTVDYITQTVRQLLRILFASANLEKAPSSLREQITSSCKATFAPFYAVARKHLRKRVAVGRHKEVA